VLRVDGRVAGAVSVEMTFTMPKPKSAPKTRRTWPATRPDLSKLVRSTEDALTDAGAWEDDARVVYCVASKVYPGEAVNALDKSGVVIRIQEASGEITNSTCLSSDCSLDAEDPLRSMVESCGPPGTSIVGAASSLLRSPVGKQLRSRPRSLRRRRISASAGLATAAMDGCAEARGQGNGYTGSYHRPDHLSRSTQRASVSVRSDEHEECGCMKKKQRTKWVAQYVTTY
jgi:Holliday junction resolvase RusA-like endonuclease